MTHTPWKSPRKIQQLESEEIEFSGVPRTTEYTSNKPVSGVSNFFGGLVTNESSAIAFTDFGFELDGKNVVGVELYLYVSRLGRTQDKTIKLFAGKTVGLNQSDLQAEDKHTYSGDLKKWGVENREIDYTAEDFGVTIDLQPHTEYPSNEIVYIRKVQVRLELAEPNPE